ncbi:hypothetical protein P7C71_g1577, partial [Lecanoromycetidae sp. Uapishka_2]
MSDIAHHLLRRGLDATQQNFNNGSDGQDDQIKRIATWGIVLIWVTGVLYLAMMSAISYTYGDVVATLAMIETPTATAFKVDSEEVDAPLLDQKTEGKMTPVEADLFLVKQQPITGKLRTAVRHLKSVGGRLARFRGLHVALIYHAAYSLIVNILHSVMARNPVLRPFIAVLTTVVLCRVQMTWTHIVISNPSQKRWYQRIPSIKAAKNIIVPTAVFAIAKQAAIYVPATLFIMVAETWQNPTAYGSNPETVQKIATLQMFLVGLIGLATVILVVIPANVTLKRVQASMLPEEDESIVPFDRTFAGKVVPEIVGGTGAIGMLDAWKSFDKSARMRLLKLYGKIFAVQVATTIMFLMIVVAELKVVMGSDFEKARRMAHTQFMHQ